MRTPSQVRGDTAEEFVAERLSRDGWRIIGRQVHIGRAEIDLLALDVDAGPDLVAVEVRWRGRRDFGLPEESVNRRKIRRLREALWTIRERGRLADGTTVPHLRCRVDLVAVEPGVTRGEVVSRHYRAVG
ncbi:MAG: YraN family protein [Chloroflexota bacterium]